MNSVLANLTNGAFKLAMQLLQEPADAYDVLQDAAAVAIVHRNAPNPHSEAFKPWFFRVVRNKAIDRLRQLKRHDHSEYDDSQAITVDGPELNLEQDQLQQAVQIALTQLPLKQREIILLKDYHNFSYKEIAEILAIPQGSVMSQLHRSRLTLRAILQAKQEVPDE